MQLNLKFKIIIVFLVLIIAWFFIRMIMLLIPLVIIAIMIGFIWDFADGREKNKGGQY
ncbi:MAG: hypothetical protein JKY22_00505 [Flavobacteriaceae bacterium]|nr:hypothetical protein [Flavobacteriaceae bacterium]